MTYLVYTVLPNYCVVMHKFLILIGVVVSEAASRLTRKLEAHILRNYSLKTDQCAVACFNTTTVENKASRSFPHFICTRKIADHNPNIISKHTSSFRATLKTSFLSTKLHHQRNSSTATCKYKATLNPQIPGVIHRQLSNSSLIHLLVVLSSTRTDLIHFAWLTRTILPHLPRDRHNSPATHPPPPYPSIPLKRVPKTNKNT
ncbi:hypothetical protein F4805DRAFT_370610 [Annulohypoxylon moriforme]|nr:hypothetical protein F4805DRAFT_370610 [Annulohypoxylon moriforme]